MYKKLIIGLCVLMVAVLMFGCNNIANSGNFTETTEVVYTISVTQTSPTDIEASIYVNDKLLESNPKALISNDFVKIPFVSVFEALGANVSWQSNTNATISYNDKTYFLDTEALTLSDSTNPNMTYLFGLYGGTYIIYAQDKEVILDSRTLEDLFERLEINVTIKYDRDNKDVYIKTR